MDKFKRISLFFAIILVSGCQSTVSGIVASSKNLFGNHVHESIDGKMIDDNSMQSYLTLADEHTGTGSLISFSGDNKSPDELSDANAVSSPKLQSYLQGIANKLIKQWPGTPVKNKVVILNKYTFGPYVDRFGHIYIPLGMLDNVESEDEIAALIGHELSHIILRHHQRQQVIEQQKALVNKTASAVVMANAIKQTKYNKGTKSFDYVPSKSAEQNIGKAAVYSYLINTISDGVISTAWGREQEEQADLLGIDLAIKAGYSPRGLVHALQRLKSFEDQQSGALEIFIKNKQASLNQAWQDKDINAFSQHAQSALGQGALAAIKSAKDFFVRSHMSPTKREFSVKTYTRKEYRVEKRQRANKLSWQKIKNSPEVKMLLAGYKYSYSAMDALSKGEIKSAEKLGLKSINKYTKNEAGIRELLYRLRLQQGDNKKAEQNLLLVKNWQQASASFYQTIVEQKMRRRDYQSALQYIEKAETHLLSQELFIDKKAIALVNVKQQQKALETLLQCKQYDSKKAQCQRISEQLQGKS